MRPRIVTTLAVIALTVPTAVSAMDPRHPDWPCHQIKVTNLSVAAFWTGPTIDDVGGAWKNDAEISDLVLHLAARRTPLIDAEKAAAEFISGTAAEKQHKARLLFAGLFETLSSERREVIEGIGRFSERQQELRQKITTELADLRAHQDAADPDQAVVDKLSDQVSWDTRIFDERRHTINYVCEVPTTIEQRLFALAHVIQQKLD